MMRGHRLSAQAFAQVPSQTLGQAPGVDEHQSGAVFAGQRCQAVVDQVPDISSHHGAERNGRHFQGQITVAGMADVDDRTVTAMAYQKFGDPLHRSLRG
ncbi:hypothetical protein D3C78_814790 [compost metagenome]